MHRPTFFPAIAKNQSFEHPTALVGRRQLSGNQTLKQRQPGQGTTDELKKRDLRQELEDREYEVKTGKSRVAELVDTPLLTDRDNETTLQLDAKLYSDADLAQFEDQDADVDADKEDSDASAESDSDDDDSDDDEEALMAEYMRIKQEREAEKLKKEQEESDALGKAALQQTLQSNPLLQSKGAQVKRRWDQDVVFRNQARTEPEAKKRFINDTIRNDFHRRFLNKFIQ